MNTPHTAVLDISEDPPQIEEQSESVDAMTINAAATQDYPVVTVTSTSAPKRKTIAEELGIDIRRPIKELSQGLDLTQPLPEKVIANSKLTIANLLLKKGNKLQTDLMIHQVTAAEAGALQIALHNNVHFMPVVRIDKLSEKNASYIRHVIGKIMYELNGGDERAQYVNTLKPHKK